MRSRRGLSTVIGAVFFVIAATTIITYISYSMNSIDEFAQSVIVSEAENINRGMEKITIAQATIVGGEFNMTVVNTGSLPVKLTRLWVVDEDTGVNSKADLDIRINPGNQKYNIGQSTGISVDSTSTYSLKLVTDRGNIATFSVSPNTSTQMQIIIPAEVAPGQEFRVVSMITNNSTLPNNIANLIPIITSNVTLTQVELVTPPSIAVLPQGNTATFTSSYYAPDTVGGIRFTANYTGAPLGAGITSNMTVAISSEAEEATQSQWSQAASRVGILISGIPNPIDGGGSGGLGKWGIGIINPLERPVDIYAISISAPDKSFPTTPLLGLEPSSGWRIKTSGESMILWEGAGTPHTIPAQSVGQFRSTFKIMNLANSVEALVIIQALSSEGKLQATYSVTAGNDLQTINMFYTNDASESSTDWGYIIEDLSSGRVDQIFNATVENTSGQDMLSTIKLVILIPIDFANVKDISGIGTADWKDANIVQNPDGSTVITVETEASTFVKNSDLVYQFSANNPVVNIPKLYVFQTTSIYPDWSDPDAVGIASALSEVGVQVNP